MTAYSAILPPTTLGEAVRPLADLSDVEFAALSKALSGPRSFSLKKNDLDDLKASLPALAPNLPFFVGALSFLYSQITNVTQAGISYRDAILGTVESLAEDANWDEKEKSLAATRLEALLQDSENRKRSQKIKRLQTGFMPNAVAFSTFVDLRPDFDFTDETHPIVRGFIPIIQFRITTDSQDADDNRFLCQLSEEALVELKKTIERVEQKIKAIKIYPSLALLEP